MMRQEKRRGRMMNMSREMADAQAAHAEYVAGRMSTLARRGICFHGYRQTKPGQGLTTCLDCGKVATDAELEDERQDLLQEYT